MQPACTTIPALELEQSSPVCLGEGCLRETAAQCAVATSRSGHPACPLPSASPADSPPRSERCWPPPWPTAWAWCPRSQWSPCCCAGPASTPPARPRAPTSIDDDRGGAGWVGPAGEVATTFSVVALVGLLGAQVGGWLADRGLGCERVVAVATRGPLNELPMPYICATPRRLCRLSSGPQPSPSNVQTAVDFPGFHLIFQSGHSWNPFAKKQIEGCRNR